MIKKNKKKNKLKFYKILEIVNYEVQCQEIDPTMLSQYCNYGRT